MKKKVLSIFLALVMVLCIAPMTALAEGASTKPAESNGESSPPEESVEEKTGTAVVQALIDALPDAESIDESNMEDVMAQLEAIDAAKDQLSDDEIASLDFTRYDAAAAALTGDGAGAASTPMLAAIGVTSVSTKEALEEAIKEDGAIQLAADITLIGTLSIEKTISLDLNGYSISGNAIYVEESLTISDSRSGTQNGKINNILVVKDNLKITSGTVSNVDLYKNATCTLSGGTIGGELTIAQDANGFIMTGGTISGTVTNRSTFNAGGGVVNVYFGNYGTIQGYGDGMTAFKGTVKNYGTISSGIYYKGINNMEGSPIKDSAYVTVNFIDSSGTIGTQQVLRGQTATQRTKAGYYNAAYYTDSGYSETFDMNSAIITSASTFNIYVTWTEKSNYTVKYNTDGGGTVSDKTGVKWTDKVLNGVTNPTKNGYEFAGWTYSAGGVTTVVTDTTTYADLAKTDTVTSITLTATWREKNSFTVTFNTDGGTAINDKTGVKWNDKVLNGVTDPTKNGYEFAGWTYSAGTVDETTTYADLAKNDTVTSITLTATWSEKNSFTVTFDTDGGTTINDKTSVKWTDTVLENITAPTKNGYEFAGWTYSADGATTVDVDETTTYAGLAEEDAVMSVTLTAQWTDIVDPVISGIEDGKTYCEAQTVTVTDENIDTVTVNGNAVILDENNQFVLSPAKGEQTIIATDKDGNEATMTVTVNDGHTPGDWITDKSATATETGSRHKECTVCGKVLEKEAIAKLVPADNTKSPQTGDNSNIFLWLALLLVSGSITAAMFVGRKKRRAE